MEIDVAIKECQKCSAEVYEAARTYEQRLFKEGRGRDWADEVVKDMKDLVILNQQRAQALYEATSALYWIEYGIL